MNRLKSKRRIIMAPLAAALALALALSAEAGKRLDGSADTRPPWLGVQVQSINADLAERYDLELKSGVYVEDVVDGSPADDAGLRPGDIILEYNGTKLESADELIDLVADGLPGDEITLKINRNGRALTELVTLKERERIDGRKFSSLRLGLDHSYGFSEELNNTYIGVSLETISGQLLAFFGSEKGSGALIKEVAEDTPAEKAGLEAGDVIVKVAGEEIESLFDVQDAVSETEAGESLNLTVLRNKREKSFTITVEERENSLFDPLLFDRSFRSSNRPFMRHQGQPRMRGLSRGSFGPGSLYFDLDDNKEAMERLRQDMRDLRRELDRLRKDVDSK